MYVIENMFFSFLHRDNFIMNENNNYKLYRKALGMYSTGIAIVTTMDDQKKPLGMTINSFTSVSLNPALVLWSIDKKQPSYDVFLNSNGYVVDYQMTKIMQKAKTTIGETLLFYVKDN